MKTKKIACTLNKTTPDLPQYTQKKNGNVFKILKLILCKFFCVFLKKFYCSNIGNSEKYSF